MGKIVPEKDLRKLLLKVSKPGRYVGGEYGSIEKEETNFSIALCFPDLYEIGMSNQAIKVLYSMINHETDSACERVFCPAPDFEAVLRENNIPLYTLETGMAVKDHDLLAFTVGYELSATNILSVLELSGISLINEKRKKSDPIVIAGGPAISNPVPFGSFIDAVYIGEAEEVFPEIVTELSESKADGAERVELIEIIRNSDFFWYKGRETRVKKAVWKGFSKEKKTHTMLVPSISTIQDHGVVEIMRGCPNGCRFCHAGIFYRPYREKDIEIIIEEVDFLVRKCGYREITLSSLSSGDYSKIGELIKILNLKYSREKISFSFPSIRVNSFTLPLISEISKVRKSGLTFAIETPELIKQRGLNKEAPKEKIIEILKEAKKLGWNKAKFYFMVGLPFFNKNDETDLIIDFLREVGRESRMQLNVNIGTFIPKPHTPFQWSFQLSEEEAFRRLLKIKNALPGKYFKMGFQSPFISLIEGLVSRGDERSGELILEAYRKGARLDAWEEYLKKEVWREIFSEAGWNVEQKICSEKEVKIEPVWARIDLGISQNFLKNELKKAFSGEMTEACNISCNHNCGVCNKDINVHINDFDENDDIKKYIENITTDDSNYTMKKNKKILFSFTKTGKASYLSHINIMNIFERALIRAGFELKYTEGFNPKPKLEFANPLTLGFESENEIASVEMNMDINISVENIERSFIDELNIALPEGIKICNVKVINEIESVKTGKKVKSLMASYGGGEFEIKCETDTVADNLEENFNIKKDCLSITRKNKTLYIKIHEDENKKILNLYKFIKEQGGLEDSFDYVHVKRLKTFCLGNELDFFSCYKS